MILPYVEIGRGARLRNVVVDRGVAHPARPRDRRGPRARRPRFRRTEKGVCLITQAMLDRLG